MEEAGFFPIAKDNYLKTKVPKTIGLDQDQKNLI